MPRRWAQPDPAVSAKATAPPRNAGSHQRRALIFSFMRITSPLLMRLGLLTAAVNLMRAVAIIHATTSVNQSGIEFNPATATSLPSRIEAKMGRRFAPCGRQGTRELWGGHSLPRTDSSRVRRRPIRGLRVTVQSDGNDNGLGIRGDIPPNSAREVTDSAGPPRTDWGQDVSGPVPTSMANGSSRSQTKVDHMVREGTWREHALQQPPTLGRPS
jgi:hypothetical protein